MNSNDMYILAIDPGNEMSAWVLIDSTLRPVKFAKEENERALQNILDLFENGKKIHVAIEMVASYGMPVGATVFETCVWIGIFKHALRDRAYITNVYRSEEKMCLCHSMKATDATITQALVDRFAYGEKNHGKGTKNNPGWFYGFSHDIWQAYAVGITYYEKYVLGKET